MSGKAAARSASLSFGAIWLSVGRR